MLLRPVIQRGGHTPAVDDIADEEELIAGVLLEEFQQAIRLTTFGTEMYVGQKDRFEMSFVALFRLGFTHESLALGFYQRCQPAVNRS